MDFFGNLDCLQICIGKYFRVMQKGIAIIFLLKKYLLDKDQKHSLFLRHLGLGGRDKQAPLNKYLEDEIFGKKKTLGVISH